MDTDRDGQAFIPSGPPVTSTDRVIVEGAEGGNEKSASWPAMFFRFGGAFRVR